MGLIGMLVVALIGIFIPWGNTGEMIFSGAGVLLFSLFAMFDIQRLRYSPEDEYINAAINLYLDLFNLFIYILRFTGAVSREYLDFCTRNTKICLLDGEFKRHRTPIESA